MKTGKLLIVAAVSTLTLTSVSCRHQTPGPLGQDGIGGTGSGSILASVGEIGSPADVPMDALDFRLFCNADATGLKGIVTEEGGNKFVSFKPEQGTPVEAGSKCRLKVIGPYSDKLEFKDKALDESLELTKRRYNYNQTTVGTLTADRKLSLHSVNRYILSGATLFYVNVTLKNTGITLSETAKANLTCGDKVVTADLAGTEKFNFAFKVGHFAQSASLDCNKFNVVTSPENGKTYKNKGDFSQLISEGSRSVQLEFELEEQTAPTTDDNGIGVNLVSILNGTFVSKCYNAAPDGENPIYQTESFKIEIAENANLGSMSQAFSRYPDEACNEALVSEPEVRSYKIEIMSLDLVSAENTLPISILKVDQASGDRIALTNTIVNVTNDELKFGKKTAPEEDAFWTGSLLQDQFPTELRTTPYKKTTPAAQ